MIYPSCRLIPSHRVTLIRPFPTRMIPLTRRDASAPFIFHGDPSAKYRVKRGEERTFPFFSRRKNHTVEVYKRRYCLIYVYDVARLFLCPRQERISFSRIIHFRVNQSSLLYCFPPPRSPSPPLVCTSQFIYAMYTVTIYLCKQRERHRSQI